MDETVKEKDLSDLLWVFGCESSTVSVWLCAGLYIKGAGPGIFPFTLKITPSYQLEAVIMFSLICTRILWLFTSASFIKFVTDSQMC